MSISKGARLLKRFSVLPQRSFTKGNGEAPLRWGKCRPIARRFISKTGMPVVFARQKMFTVVLISPVPEHVDSDFHISPSGFPLGTFSDRDFCEFIRTAPSHIQNSVVCDMVWWESKRKPLHHQFLVLTVAHRQASGNDRVAAMYDICIERVGKAVQLFSRRCRAEDHNRTCSSGGALLGEQQGPVRPH